MKLLRFVIIEPKGCADESEKEREREWLESEIYTVYYYIILYIPHIPQTPTVLGPWDMIINANKTLRRWQCTIL